MSTAAAVASEESADVAYLTAAETAARIRDGRLSSAEAVEACLARIHALDGIFRAVLDLHAAAARERAREADAAAARGEWWGPLHGVPVTIKDSWDVAGMRSTFGYPPTRDNVARRDATAVARLRAAGAVVLGKTHVPLGVYDWQCRSPVGGTTRNPWDPARTPGGSSGGSAAAVAAGFSALELGSDVAGSIRVPAHFCGVFGLKPTEGRVSGIGHGEVPGYPRSLRHLCSYGPIARSVEDLELAMSLVAGADERGPDAPPVPFAPAPPRDAASLRVAWTDGFGGLPVSADVAEAIRGVVAKLEAAGARVERAHPPLEVERALETWGEIDGPEVGIAIPWIARRAARLGVAYRFGPGPFSRGLARGLGMDVRRYFAALTRRDEMSEEMERFLAGYDAWLCPVAAVPAITHRRTGAPVQVDGRPVSYSIAVGAYSVLVSLLGNPSISVPVALSSEGLPIGLQVVGRRWDDAGVLGVAKVLEALTGGFRRPPLSAATAGMAGDSRIESGKRSVRAGEPARP